MINSFVLIINMVEETILISEEKSMLFKKALAKSLYNKKIDQIRISKILNLSQPMVSNYISSKENLPSKVQNFSEQISNQILNGKKIHFHTCILYSEEPKEGPYFIANKNEIISEEKNKIIDNLTEAFLKLKEIDLTGFIPQVKINIALAMADPVDTDDIAAFQNGLIIIDNKVSSNNGIKFGKSKHLSNLLLYLKSKIEVNAIMNIAYRKDLEKTKFIYGLLTKDFKLKNSNKKVDILLHKGDFGIEPCAYILGRDAVDVVNKFLKIREEIK
jgi:hypothetical protein